MGRKRTSLQGIAWVLVVSCLAAGLAAGYWLFGGSSSGRVTSAAHRTWYVSRNGDGADGRSWTTAWSELAGIKWSEIKPGDTIVIDGGSTACTPAYEFTTPRPGLACGMEYQTTMDVGASGLPKAPITVRLSLNPGHDGTAVLFGGRTKPLPYCHQASYSSAAVRTYGINVGSNHDLAFDGSHISGFMIYGAVKGVEIPGSSPGDITLEHMEIFDNGSVVSPGGWSGPGFTSDNEGLSLGGGRNDRLIGDLVHDNGNDEISDSDEPPRPSGSLNGLVLDTDWIYNYRDNPLYPGNGFNGPEASCLHVDGLQLSNGGQGQGPMTIAHTIWGPLINQGLYPDDLKFHSSWNNVTVTDSLFATIRHNIISNAPVKGWVLNDDTLFAPQGGFELPSNGPNAITNVIKLGGYVYVPDWSGTTTGSVWYQGDPLPGASFEVDPDFVAVPDGSNPTFQQFEAANFAPRCSGCGGSSLHSFVDIVTRIRELAP
jgi:hypothetical protein